jgi:hypothetical protein
MRIKITYKIRMEKTINGLVKNENVSVNIMGNKQNKNKQEKVKEITECISTPNRLIGMSDVRNIMFIGDDNSDAIMLLGRITANYDTFKVRSITNILIKENIIGVKLCELRELSGSIPNLVDAIEQIGAEMKIQSVK